MHRYTEQDRAYKQYRRIQTDEQYMTDDNWEHRHNVSESADKVRLKTQLKRGSGTRDEDKIEVQVKGDDPEECVRKLNKTIEELAETVETVRGVRGSEADNDE